MKKKKLKEKRWQDILTLKDGVRGGIEKLQ